MSKFSISLLTLLLLLSLPFAAMAQDEDAPERPFVYATYFDCDAADMAMADMIIETVFKPVNDAAVDDGTIGSWGWYAHHTGGKWRRLLYHTAATTDALLDANDVTGKKVSKTNAAAVRKFGEICDTHEDYIWQFVSNSENGNSSEVAEDSTKASISSYMVCKMTEQERSDELMAMFRPVYDRHIAEGELTGWGWLEHSVGGKYRRLVTMQGTDHKNILKAWGGIIEDLVAEHGDAFKEFNEICFTHQDYLWDVIHQK